MTRSRNPVKGVKVRFTGAGVSLASLTNGKGVARVAFKTTKAGIIRVHITNVKACNTLASVLSASSSLRSRARGIPRAGTRSTLPG